MTPLAMAVLALLSEHPMHPYEMYQLLIKRRNDRMVKVRPGSLYHTVERLAGQGMVEATGTDRAGNRPERTTYAITDAGRQALVHRVQDAIESAGYEYPVFPVALSEAHNLTARDAVTRLNRRADRLDAQLEDVQAAIEEARTEKVAEAYWMAADYLSAMLAAERDWLRRSIARIESKELPWPRRPRN